MVRDAGLIRDSTVIYRTWLFATFLLLSLGLQVFSCVYYIEEQRALTGYLNRVAIPSATPSELAKDVVSSLKTKPDENSSYFFLPVFRPLRPSPWQVLEKGGDCADRSRLVIALLRLRGVHASKWALYNPDGESVHAVVEADVESGKMVVDPLFGMWFPKPQGGYYAIRDLKQDPKLLQQRIADLRAQGVRPGTDSLELYPLDQYIYVNARTINWSKNAVWRLVYLILHGLIGDRADQLDRPALAEEPALMVICGAAGFECVVVFVWLYLRRKARKSLTSSHSKRLNLQSA